MDPTKLLELLLANGDIIIKGKANNDKVFENWYIKAEPLLSKVFGDDWRDVITWEGYKSEGSFDSDRARLKRATEYIKTTIPFFLNVPKSSTETKSAPPSPKSSTGRRKNARIFIVHGHDDIAKLELKNYLQNILQLPEPIILHEKPNQGRAIIEKFEEYASEATFAFVLLTPDDTLADEENLGSKLYRARQNVILEMGYFLGLFGRKRGRLILLYKGKLDIPSDISGLVYIDISNGIESVGEKIRKELSGFI